MEESTTRKRFIDPKTTTNPKKYKVYEQVYILACLRDAMPKICDSLSITLRAAVLVDLALEKSVTFRNNKIYFTCYNGNDPLLEKITKQIMNAEMTPKDLLKSINGENYFSFSFNLHIKKLRHNISKSLECAGKISYSNNRYKYFKGKVTVDPAVKRELINEMVEYLKNENDDLHNLAVLMCIKYCGALPSVFFSLPPLLVTELKLVVSNYESKVRAGAKDSDHKTVYEILKALITL